MVLRLVTQPRLPFNASAFGEMLLDLHGDLESNLVQQREKVEGGKVNQTNVYLGKFIEGVEFGISTEIGFYYQQFSEIKVILRTKGTVKWRNATGLARRFEIESGASGGRISGRKV